MNPIKSIMLLLGLLLGLTGASAQIYEVGVFAGSAYYMGDLNPSRQFHNPDMALGALMRYNHNQHLSARANLNYGRIGGSDSDSPFNIDPDPESPVYEFRTRVFEASLQGEINFLPFDPGYIDTPFTPYIFGGAGAVYYDPRSVQGNSTEIEATDQFTHLWLFGLGVKFNISRYLTAGTEWGMRHTATDYLDKVHLQGNPKNNDWYSFAGLVLTFKFRDNSRHHCPYNPY